MIYVHVEVVRSLKTVVEEKFSFKLNYVKKPRVKVLSEIFKADSYEEKSLKAKGVRVAAKEVQSIEIQTTQPKKSVEKKTETKE